MKISATAEDLKVNLRKFAKLTDQSVSYVVRSVAFQLFKKIVAGTPVDTGHARQNWNISVNEVDTTVLPRPDPVLKGKGAAATLMRASLARAAENTALAKMQNVPENGEFDKIILANSVSYILFLEEGTPHMAPFSMVANAFADVAQELKILAAEAKRKKAKEESK